MYSIGEFAKLAGVTVRTLHHYDRMGLLHPTGRTENGHRRYTRADLLRVQQILSLKWMGYSLEDARDLLESDTYDLRASLAAQKAAVDAQIQRLQAASAALAGALALADPGEVDADAIRTILRAVTTVEQDEEMRRYYSDDAWESIQTRRLAYSPEEMAQVARDWQTLFDDFRAHMHLPPEHPSLAPLVARQQALLALFSGGDPDVEAGMQAFADDQMDRMGQDAVIADNDPDLAAFMRAAVAAHQKRS